MKSKQVQYKGNNLPLKVSFNFGHIHKNHSIQVNIDNSIVLVDFKQLAVPEHRYKILQPMYLFFFQLLILS